LLKDNYLITVQHKEKVSGISIFLKRYFFPFSIHRRRVFPEPEY